MTSKQLLSSKLTIVLLTILLGFFANMKFQQWNMQKAINREKQNLSNQAAALEQKNNELSQSLSYLNSSDFKERVARQQLGLKKEGEKVFDFSEAPVPSGSALAANSASGKSNYQKWWNYFTNGN